MEPLEHTISAQIAKYPKLVILGLLQTTEKMPKRMVYIIGHPKNEPGTQTEPFKPIWLTLRTMVNWIPDRGLFVPTLGFLHIAIKYHHFLAKRVVQDIENHNLECFSN